MSAMRRGGRAAGWDQPLFERLEERLFLTGNVAVGVSGQALTLTGDDLHNEIVIDAFGLQANQFRVTGVSNTTLNGGAAPITVDNIRDIKARLGAGDDILTFMAAILLGGLTVDGGSGITTLTLWGFGVGKNVAYRGAGHFNWLTLDSGTVGGNVTLDGGYGGTQVRIKNNVVINGNLSVRGGDGYDDVAITNGSNVKKNVTVNAGIGGSKLELDSVWLQGKVSLRADTGADEVRVTGGQMTCGMDIRTGLGADTCLFDHVMMGPLKASLGEGDNSVTMWGGMMGRASIRGGGGQDTVSLWSGAMMAGLRFDAGGGVNKFQLINSSIIQGDFRYRGGDAQDTVWLSDSSTIMGNAQIDLGSGDLQHFTALTNININGSLRIRGGPQQDDFAFYSTKVVGDFRLDGGAGPDTLTADDSRFWRGVSINMGAGSDTIWLDFQAPGSPPLTVFEGPVSIQMGEDDDHVRLGMAGNANLKVEFKDRLAIDGGKGFGDFIGWQGAGNAVFAFPPMIKGFEIQA